MGRDQLHGDGDGRPFELDPFDGEPLLGEKAFFLGYEERSECQVGQKDDTEPCLFRFRRAAAERRTRKGRQKKLV